jgi:FixJ family two-component response regulator
MTHKQTDPPTVFVVDDDAQSRKSVEQLMRSIKLRVESFESADEFLDAFDPARPGCLVLDVRMPGMSGLELQERLIEQRVQIPIVMITAHAEVPMAVQAVKAGALDFLEKPYSPQTLLDRVQEALQYESRTRQEHLELTGIEARLGQLSPREQEVMQLLVKGRNTKSIARELSVSDKTVDFHRRNLLEKMQVETVVELARLIEFHERSQGWRRSAPL